jgi:hypothetical protein
MKKYASILMIGSDTKKAGKTTLACQIIRQYCSSNDITAVKVACFDLKDNHLDRSEIVVEEEKYKISEQLHTKGNSDTSRYLKAGAKRAFFLCAQKDYLKDAFEAFLKKLSKNTILICESTSLRLFIKPGIFIFIENRQTDKDQIKEYADPIKKLADRIINYEGGHFDVSGIELIDNKWQLKKQIT